WRIVSAFPKPGDIGRTRRIAASNNIDGFGAAAGWHTSAPGRCRGCFSLRSRRCLIDYAPRCHTGKTNSITGGLWSPNSFVMMENCKSCPKGHGAEGQEYRTDRTGAMQRFHWGLLEPL